jgi:hypothetical protein
MTPAEYVLTSDFVAGGILATSGYGLLYRGRAWFSTIRVCFWLAAAALVSSGFIWAFWVNEPKEQLWVRVVVATLSAAGWSALLAFALWHVDAKNAAALDNNPAMPGSGGKGGSAKTAGRRSHAIGGQGGRAGTGGIGGEGGSAEAGGDDSTAMGGDGGNAGEPSGRGGRRPLSPGERLNLSTDKWAFGVGGRGANAPEYDRRLHILTILRARYVQVFPQDAIFIQAGVDQVPIRWINKCLEEMNEPWRVLGMNDGGYEMPPL